MKTATTPSAFRASSAAIPVTRALAYGLRTTTIASVPAGAMLSTYVPRPVSSDRSSRRLTGEPTYERRASVALMPPSLAAAA